MFKRAVCLFLTISVFASILIASAAQISTAILPDGLGPPELTASAAIVAELNSGQILYGKDQDQALPMASLTKVMTTLLALEHGLEHGTLDRDVTASASALDDMGRFEDWGSNVGMKDGEIMSLRNLLYCVMVSSANEACNVAAEAVSGSIDAFIELMNRRARELGCKNTLFKNTHGLHEDGHNSSAYDMYLITAEAMRHIEFMEMANTTSKSIPPTNLTGERTLNTTNHLLSKRGQDKYLYHLAEGIKTGHHSQAGYCLISSARSGDLHLLTVVMGCAVLDDTIMSFTETRDLIEWGLGAYEFKRVLSASDSTAMIPVPVQMGDGFDAVNVKPAGHISALIPKILDAASITRQITLPDEVTAPVTKGQVIGEMTLTYRGHKFGAVDLIADFSVKRDDKEFVMDISKDFLTGPELRYTLFAIGGLLLLYTIITILYNRYRRRNHIPSNYRGKKRKRY